MGRVNLREVMLRSGLFGLDFSPHVSDLEWKESHWLSLLETSRKTAQTYLFIHSFVNHYMFFCSCQLFNALNKTKSVSNVFIVTRHSKDNTKLYCHASLHSTVSKTNRKNTLKKIE